MNTFFSASAVILLNCYFWLRENSLSEIYLELSSKNLGLWKDAVVVALMFIVLLDLLLRKQRLSSKSNDIKKLEQKLNDTEVETKTLSEQLNVEKITADNQAEEHHKHLQKLETALREAQARIAQSQTHSLTARPESIDAELVNLLSTFQEKGRLIDFLMEDISRFPESQVAAAARVVHQGCSSVLKEYFSISPIHSGKEGEPIEIDSKSPAGTYRLVGKIAGTPPYKGIVLHRGWETETIRLPRLVEEEHSSIKRKIISPTQIEIR